jgi:predicted lactoylglutathione lyase
MSGHSFVLILEANNTIFAVLSSKRRFSDMEKQDYAERLQQTELLVASAIKSAQDELEAVVSTVNQLHIDQNIRFSCVWF